MTGQLVLSDNGAHLARNRPRLDTACLGGPGRGRDRRGRSGIGAATARRLAADGAAVTVCDVTDAAGEAVAAGLDGRSCTSTSATAARGTSSWAGSPAEASSGRY